MTQHLATPAYDRAALRPRILHLGFGGFARAHPLVFLDAGLSAAGGDWGVIAARLNSGAGALRALAAAGGRYHVAEADGATVTVRRVDAVIGTLHPDNDGPDAVPDRIAAPELSAVQLTITEKGYRPPEPGTDPARHAIAVIAEGLARRRAAGLGGVTVLSCDNLAGNGRLTRRAVLALAGARDPALADWITRACRFPDSMVDRITPAMGAEGHALVRAATGRDDPHAIMCEPFRQWVIEDAFAGPAPPYAAGGARIVADVRPFEEMKLRMLNGAHTFLACLGQLAGHDTVAACMSDPPLRRAVHGLMMRELAPTLEMPSDVDLAAYAETLMTRFANTRLHHRLDQIATDTSQKMPQRLFAPAAHHLRSGAPWPRIALAIAGWLALLRRGGARPDPRGEDLARAAAGPDPVAGLIAADGIVPAALAGDPRFAAAVDAARAALEAGVAHALDRTETP